MSTLSRRTPTRGRSAVVSLLVAVPLLFGSAACSGDQDPVVQDDGGTERQDEDEDD